MNSNPIMLWLMQAPDYRGQDAYIGKLLFARFRADSTSAKGIRITLEPMLHQEFLLKHERLHWVALQAEVTSQKAEPRTYGRVTIEAHQSQTSGMPRLEASTREIEWNWRLSLEDLEQIERERSDAAASPLHFNVSAEGTIQAGSDTYMVRGDGNLEIALSDWESYLRILGYNLPPSAAELAGLAAAAHPSWAEAAKRLAGARVQLRAGEGRPAMMTCLREFERIVTAPYKPESWQGLFAVPKQKEEGLVTMLAGHCAYLNKVGYHRSREDRDQEGGLMEMPTDQWEAELVVGASQFWLAYVLRAA